MMAIKKQRSRKWLWWTLAIIALIIYSIIVGCWIAEGNRNFEADRQSVEASR